MANAEEVERVVQSIHETRADRDRLAEEVEQLRSALSLQQAETDRQNVVIARLSSERDMYQCRVAVISNELGIIRNMIADAERKARADSFGRPEMESLDDEASLAQISYTKRRQ